MTRHAYLYLTEDGEPAWECPECHTNWNEEGGVDILFSVGGHSFQVPSRLDEEGQLVDVEDGAVAKGLHAGTHCGHCCEPLVNLVAEIHQEFPS